MAKITGTKKLLSHLILCFFSVFSFINSANAGSSTFKVTNPIATSDFAKIVANFLKWILGVAGSIAFIMLIVGGIMYMTAAGDQQKASSAKKLIMVTLGGLMLVLLSYAILVILNDILT
jgi:hypothetical protein